MKSRIVVLLFLVLMPFNLLSQDSDGNFRIKVGDTAGLINAIKIANSGTGALIVVEPGDNGETDFVFTGPADGFESALPDITSDIEIIPAEGTAGRITFRTEGPAAGDFRLFKVTGTMGKTLLTFDDFDVQGFGTSTGDGGVVLLEGNAEFQSRDCNFRNNFAGRNGGVIALHDFASANLYDTKFTENRSGNVGGAISAQDKSHASFYRCHFANNSAAVFGCDLNLNTNDSSRPRLCENSFPDII